ncbi:ComE operon protein 2 [Caldibacillus lycopersici]|uniref:ComE operon protein 2 n=1 Tax=Perspicuibacillus lycopersici TaxID=1325689 RepID=A0AAE3ISS8_9BACI|nr:ComE operon protein 2 [Perspicuibacillus lycopersici]MCU9613943.1 ComE operon protein 2 [Perspicuibacillus lycopersici]
MERIAWDQYFMAQSHILSLRSTCTRLMVGATIVRDKRVIAGGYNGSIAGGDHCMEKGCYVIENHCVRTIHAEMNAVIQCAKFGVPTENAEIYVTHFPCLQCTKGIIQSGIRAIYYAEDYKNHPYALELLEQANIKVQKVPFPKDLFDENQLEKKQLVNEMLEELANANLKDSQKAAFVERAKRLFN